MKEYESPGSKKDRAPNCRWCKRDSDTPRRTSLAYMMIEIRGIGEENQTFCFLCLEEGWIRGNVTPTTRSGKFHGRFMI